jgi:hypothetical protein
MIDVGPGAALVLGGEPMRTTFFPTEDGGLFARWGYASGEEGVRRAIGTIPPTLWTPLPFRFRAGRDGALLLDSVYAGDDLRPPEAGMDPRWLRLDLAKACIGSHSPTTGPMKRLG